MSETPSDDELNQLLDYAENEADIRNDPLVIDLCKAVADLMAGRVSSAPSREAIAEALYASHFDLLAEEETDPTWTEITESQRDYWRMLADAVVALMKENQGDKG